MKRIPALLLPAFCAFSLGSPAALAFTTAPAAELHAQKNVACASCHRESPPAKKVKTAQCMTCHGDYAQLADRTRAMTPNNVHANHLGDIDCSECHAGHKEKKIACDECHQFEFKMPGK